MSTGIPPTESVRLNALATEISPTPTLRERPLFERREWREWRERVVGSGKSNGLIRLPVPIDSTKPAACR